jgi:hypothetical protein
MIFQIKLIAFSQQIKVFCDFQGRRKLKPDDVNHKRTMPKENREFHKFKQPYGSIVAYYKITDLPF